jgi:diguanylate cyclase (GGDEF)-like protein/PAS domain S-box-containing protein
MSTASAFDAALAEHGNEILLLVERHTLAIRAANGGALRHLGYPRETLLGRPITDLECALADVFYWDEVRDGQAGELVDAEASYLCADGRLLDATKTVTRSAINPDWLVVCAVPAGKLRRAEEELAEMSARLRAALEATADGILLIDRGGAILNMNQRFAQLWQIPAALLVGHDDDAIHDYLAGCMVDPCAYRARLREICPDADDETFDLLQLADGRSLERKSRPARQRNLVIGRVFSFTDVTERRKLETRLKLAASVFTHAHEGIMITDANATIVDVNDTFTQITGYTRDEVIGRNARILSSGRQKADFYASMWQELKARGHWHGELWNRRSNGELYAEKLNIAAVRDADGASQHYVALFSDITALKEHQRQLEHMAHYDALTGIPNRVLLADRLRQAIAQTRRRQRLMAVAYLDLDGFKAVNDVHGHEAGDQLLIAIARRLKEVLREGDTLARLGGDEFVAVLTDLGSTAECELIVARLLKAAATPVHIKNHTLKLSASLGVTLYPQDGSDADTLLRHADHAMYQAKQTGKNRYHLFDPERDRETQSHRESIEQMAQALARSEFVLHYQPRVNMRTGEVVGAEALLRWQHPQRGLLLPGEFLPLIEGNELIAHIGDWVLDQALAQMAAWRRAGLDLAVSVNIAAIHLQQEGFQTRLEEKLAAHPDVSAQRLELEVLETAALEGVVRVSQVIEACQALGVNFSLDDFGTGYSSLTYLKRLPATLLKIDRSFVHDMLWDTEDLAIVEGVIGLATAFRRAVIAEGVETAAHGRLLLRLGCELAQGFGIARPMPPQQLAHWVRSWHPQPAWSARCDTPLHRDDLPLAYAEVELRGWIRGLDAYCDGGTLTVSSTCERSRARLNDWFDGSGRRRYGQLSGFATLWAEYKRALAIGRDLVTARAVDDLDTSRRLLGELHALADDLIAGLYALAIPSESVVA